MCLVWMHNNLHYYSFSCPHTIVKKNKIAALCKIKRKQNIWVELQKKSYLFYGLVKIN